jgi:hypothetical protein
VSVTATFPQIRARHESLTREALRRVFAEQRDVVAAGRSLSKDWDAPLARTIYTRNRNTAADIGGQVAAKLRGEFDPELLEAWLTKNADVAAESINDSTRAALEAADDKSAVFEVLLGSALAQYARSMVTSAANKGAKDAAEQSGARTKTWVSSGGPRHSSMGGETVPLGSSFSNGMDIPGDPDGGAEEVANCGCSVSFD